MNKMIQYRHAWVIICNEGEVYIYYISFGMCYDVLSSYVLLAYISTIKNIVMLG